MSSRTGQVFTAATALALTALTVAACSGAAPSPGSAQAGLSSAQSGPSSRQPGPGGAPLPRNRGVPAEFRKACGHPGAHVEIRKVPVTIRHAECDLTGVALSYRNHGGATVPAVGGEGIFNSMGFWLTVHPGTLDVTVKAGGPVGNV